MRLVPVILILNKHKNIVMGDLGFIFEEIFYRVNRKDQKRLPYRLIGIVKAKIEVHLKISTGILISPNLVLTSASICFSRHLQKTFG